MNKKFFLFRLGTYVLMALVVAVTIYAVSSSQLKSGSAADLTALAPVPRSGSLTAQSENACVETWKSIEQTILAEPEQFGGVFCYEEDRVLRIYRKEGAAEIGNLPDSVQVLSCRYSLAELNEALEKLDAYLETAPESIQNSVQISLIAPRENRVAVFVKDWGPMDQVDLARAMGNLCGRFFVVNQNLDQFLPEMTFVSAKDWKHHADAEQLSVSDALDWTCMLNDMASEYVENLTYSRGDRKTWRTGGLTFRYQMLDYSPAYIAQKCVGTDAETGYVYFETWGSKPAQLLRVIYRDAVHCPYPITIIYEE